MKKAIMELIILLAISLGIAVIGNAVNPSGIPYFGQWDDEQGMVFAGGPCTPSTTQILDAELLTHYLAGSAVIVDARSSDDFNLGHIPFSVSLPLGEVHEKIYDFMETHPIDSQIITYCSGVDCHDSHDLAKALEEYGYSNVSVYSQGITGWTKRQRPLKTTDDEEM